MVNVCTVAPLGALAQGTFGFNVEEQRIAYGTALEVVSDPHSFAPVRTLEKATCLDDRLGENGLRRDLAHMPGGGMTLALMKHLVRNGLMQESSYFHLGCYAFHLGVPMVKEILSDPIAELELLWRLDVQATDNAEALHRLQDWALRGLPDNFLEPAKFQEAFVGMHNPILAVVNQNRPYATLRQEVVANETGYLAFSLDMWAARPLAEQLAADPFDRECLELLYQVLSIGMLRRVGSMYLPVVVV